jgi:hypothetical protein
MPLRFAHEQVNVVRHHDVSKEVELVTVAEFF